MLTDRHFQEQTNKARDYCDTCWRTVFFCCSIRKMNVNWGFLNLIQFLLKFQIWSSPKLKVINMGLNPTQCYVYTFFHDITQLTCDLNSGSWIGICYWFYHKKLAPHRSPSHTIDNTDSIPLFMFVPFAQKIFNFFKSDFFFLWIVFPCDLSTNFGNLSFQLSDTHLIAIFNDLSQSIILELNFISNSIFLYLKWKQVVFGNLELLLSCITRNFNQLKTIKKWWWQFQRIGCTNEHNFWKIDRDTDVMIDKGGILWWVQDL